ncbi:hypothetical protein N781_15190 [Pontibacillus halophilus JSM 076056 = DSM 19796]|uniref:YppF-like protein n=1 Tax=Pontibacillus halophilus JSM 076056 = DSM 19796 TaxID=1385510 RepID=A0A0A5IA01_9BACI|nr:YppF family protein [Pontibacillus halophilus]KGX92662.1 hypothetical protein N781_15190 [Pontibacillus halophilus JSM 076056 = DSM 19796]
MRLNELEAAFKERKEHSPRSADELLDYCQHQYMSGNLEVNSYRQLFQKLTEKGAHSSHEQELEEV